ncbi:MAG: toast rack family protein [Gemmatimonadota bacterium]
MKTLLLVLVSMFAVGAPGDTGSWRSLAASRPRGTVDSLHVVLRYDAGTLTVGAAAAPLLYDAKAKFDANQQRISRSYNAVSHTLRVGLDSSTMRTGARHSTRKRSDGGRLDLALAAGIPVDLDLDLGTTRAMLDLSALWVDAVRVSAGATEAELTFGSANPKPMRDLFVDAGVGSITIHSLGNARAQRATIASTVGAVDLDMAGEWTGDMPITLRIALGSATLRVPRDVGVSLHLARRIASIDSEGFTERDGVSYSTGYEQARRHVIVDGSATLANVDIVWKD